MDVKTYFNNAYKKYKRYWWLNENRYSLEVKNHVQYHAEILYLARNHYFGKALDIGAGEGSDAIRLALLGYEVDAVELSDIGSEKIEHFSKEKNVSVNVINDDINKLNIEDDYDIILCNGVLHYLNNKGSIIDMIKKATKKGGINAITCFSNATEIPESHSIVPIYPDDEYGIIINKYKDWDIKYSSFERNKLDKSHPGHNEHFHSFIKIIASRL